MSTFETVFWTMLLKPFVLLVVLGGLAAVRILVQRKMRDGKLKRTLLRRV